jgi:hypothetical protein
MKLTDEQAEAAIRLSNNEDFKLLYEAINSYRHELLEFTMYGQEGDAHTYRGMARGVTEIMRAVGSAREQLNRRKN